MTVFLEVDRRGGLLSGLTDTDERTTQFVVTDESASAVTEKLRSVIEQHA